MSHSSRIPPARALAWIAALPLLAGCSTFMMKETEVVPDSKEVVSTVIPAGDEADLLEMTDGQEVVPDDVILGPDGRRTKFYRVRHMTAAELIRLVNLRFYSGEGKPPGTKVDPSKEHARLQAHRDLNMVIIHEEKERLDEIVRFLERVDRLTTQIQIDITMVEISSRYQFEYGFDFFLDRAPASNAALRSLGATYNNRSFIDSILTGSSFQGTSLTFGSVGSVVTELGDLSLVLRALEEKGHAKILAEPSIVIHGGEEAEINAIEKQPIQQLEQINAQTSRITTRYEDVGVKFKVKVQNIGADAALLFVNPEVSTVTSFTDPQQFGGLSVPIIAKRDAKTVLDVRDGDRLVIGGLKDTRTLVEHRQIPILGSIPIIGALFKSRREREETTEILFILEVQILDEERKSRMKLQIPGEGF